VTGILYNNGTLKKSGNGNYDGEPASEVDPTLNPTDMKNDFEALKKLVTLIVTSDNPPAMEPAYTAAVPQKCNAAVESNWGEPSPAAVTTTGSVVFYGPVFVTGTLSTSGNSGQGAKFYGGVVAGNVALDDVTKLAGGALVNYSSCAVRRALANTATPMPFAERSWVQLYN
jgi:hypothetical protein